MQIARSRSRPPVATHDVIAASQSGPDSRRNETVVRVRFVLVEVKAFYCCFVYLFNATTTSVKKAAPTIKGKINNESRTRIQPIIARYSGARAKHCDHHKRATQNNFLSGIMREFQYSVLVILISFVWGSFAHEVSTDRHAYFSFSSLVDIVNDDFLATSKLLEKLHFENCSNLEAKNQPCPRCFTLNDYEKYTEYKASTPLNSTQFLQIAPIFVYLLLPEKNSGLSSAVCKTPPLPEKLFDALVANYSGEGAKGITQEALEEILKRINQTFWKYLHKKDCFSAHSIFEEIREDPAHEEHDHEDHEPHESEHSSLDEQDFKRACASVIFHLVEGYCIEDNVHNETSDELPHKTFFISDLFGGKKMMTEANLKEVAKKLGIGKLAGKTHADKEDNHAGHKHRRSVHTAVLQKEMAAAHNIHRRAVEDHHGHHAHKEGSEHGESGDNFNSTCFPVDDLLTVFGIDHDVGVDQQQFMELCPAFIQQFQSGVCSPSTESTKIPAVTKDMAKIWGYGFAAVTIISVLSLAGVATIPFIRKNLYKKVLAFLVALAVGSLAGDGILHLIPHAFGLHAHEHTEPSDDSHYASAETQPFLWKALMVLVAIYAFFLFETLMHLCLKSKIHEHGTHSHLGAEQPGPSSRHMSFKSRGRSCSKLEHREGAVEEEIPSSSNGAIVLANVQTIIKNDEHRDDSRRGDTHLTFDQESHLSKNKISAVAWMIIIGDTLHNISDGLAIGAALSEGGSSGISGGISTSIAVFCHELPHELGDFAVLLTAGMSVKVALLANFLSACSCYVGLVIGIAVGQQTDVRLWIFAIAGGMFIYVALVDMLPDLMHSETLQTEPVLTFCLQNLGLLTGIVIMLMIALYEEDLMAVRF